MAAKKYDLVRDRHGACYTNVHEDSLLEGEKVYALLGTVKKVEKGPKAKPFEAGKVYEKKIGSDIRRFICVGHYNLGEDLVAFVSQDSGILISRKPDGTLFGYHSVLPEYETETVLEIVRE